MSALSDCTEIYCDRVTIIPANPSSLDSSGGRVESNAVSLSSLPCSIQSGGMQDVMLIGSVQIQIETKVSFPSSPGPLTTGTKIRVDLVNGAPPERQAFLIVQRIVREGVEDTVFYRADCLGRA